jgi:hypothetical protein
MASHLAKMTGVHYHIQLFLIVKELFCLGWSQTMILLSLPTEYLGLQASVTMPTWLQLNFLKNICHKSSRDLCKNDLIKN